MFVYFVEISKLTILLISDVSINLNAAFMKKSERTVEKESTKEVPAICQNSILSQLHSPDGSGNNLVTSSSTVGSTGNPNIDNQQPPIVQPPPQRSDCCTENNSNRTKNWYDNFKNATNWKLVRENMFNLLTCPAQPFHARLSLLGEMFIEE